MGMASAVGTMVAADALEGLSSTKAAPPPEPEPELEPEPEPEPELEPEPEPY